MVKTFLVTISKSLNNTMIAQTKSGIRRRILTVDF